MIDENKLIEDVWKHSNNITSEWETAGILNLINKQPKVGEWIPVSERLPENSSWNIFTDGKNISVERYKIDGIDHFFPPGRWFDLDDAIAWRPLPEPYKGE